MISFDSSGRIVNAFPTTQRRYCIIIPLSHNWLEKKSLDRGALILPRSLLLDRKESTNNDFTLAAAKAGP